MEGEPDVISRGVVMSPGSEELLRESARLIGQVVGEASLEERTDQGLVKEKIRVELRRFFRKRSGRRPLVLPVIMEI
jgi:ribonuclease J